VAYTGFGKVVPPRDPDALRRAILGRPRSNRPREGRQVRRSKAEFGVEACLDAYERLLTVVIDDSMVRRS
jgi:hypothetical protein